MFPYNNNFTTPSNMTTSSGLFSGATPLNFTQSHTQGTQVENSITKSDLDNLRKDIISYIDKKFENVTMKNDLEVLYNALKK